MVSDRQSISLPSRKVAIVGCGNVGSTFAYTLLLSGLANVYLSLPAVIDRRGIARVLELDLSPSEREAFRSSAASVKAAIDQLRV